jgi:hypothetical protein
MNSNPTRCLLALGATIGSIGSIGLSAAACVPAAEAQAATATGAVSATRAESKPRAQSASAACAAPTSSSARRTSAAAEWTATPVAQKSLATITTTLEATFGKATKTNHGRQLARGLVGQVLDDEPRSAVVVVDPAMVDRQALQRRLDAAAHDVQQEADRPAPALRVRVRPACHSARELVEADQVITARDWHPQAREVTFVSYLDASTSAFHVTFWRKDAAVAEALKDTLGDRVAVDFGSPMPFVGRNDDNSPHYGGSRVSLFDGFNVPSCTAGFTVVFDEDGRRGSVTAGHCVENGDTLLSGSHIYGTVEGKNFFPTFDMARINDVPDQTFANVIYTDPGSPITRFVTGSSQPFQGQLLCVSGQQTKAKCQLQVVDFTGMLCFPPAGCATDLMRARRAGTVVGRKGDSGGPVYTQGPNNTALINGMIVGGTEIISAPDGAQMILAETIQNVEIGLDAHVATSF